MPADGFRAPIELRGRHIELVPLATAHAADLAHAARDPETSRFLREPVPSTEAAIGPYIAMLLDRHRAGTDLPFTTRLLPHGPAIGMTRYLNIDRPNRNVEIGGTWLDSAFWRTAVNTESKYLLLRHAFEVEGVRRVQLQTDQRNERSQRAIARIGGVREALLRENVLLANGYFRSSVIYSLLESEWPAAKARLEGMLARPWQRPGGL